MAIQKPTNKMEVILLSFAAIIVILVLYLSALAIYDLVNKAGDTASEMTHEESHEKPQNGYFAVSEWGIQMKIPDSLTDVKYKIIDGRDSVVFVAKPKGADVEYVSDLDSDLLKYARVQLYRNTLNTIAATQHGDAMKIGDYYHVIFTSSDSKGLFTNDDAGEYENTVTADLIEMLNTAKSLK
jgi:hypothetical protein